MYLRPLVRHKAIQEPSTRKIVKEIKTLFQKHPIKVEPDVEFCIPRFCFEPPDSSSFHLGCSYTKPDPEDLERSTIPVSAALQNEPAETMLELKTLVFHISEDTNVLAERPESKKSDSSERPAAELPAETNTSVAPPVIGTLPAFSQAEFYRAQEYVRRTINEPADESAPHRPLPSRPSAKRQRMSHVEIVSNGKEKSWSSRAVSECQATRSGVVFLEEGEESESRAQVDGPSSHVTGQTEAIPIAENRINARAGPSSISEHINEASPSASRTRIFASDAITFLENTSERAENESTGTLASPATTSNPSLLRRIAKMEYELDLRTIHEAEMRDSNALLLKRAQAEHALRSVHEEEEHAKTRRFRERIEALKRYSRSLDTDEQEAPAHSLEDAMPPASTRRLAYSSPPPTSRRRTPDNDILPARLRNRRANDASPDQRGTTHS